MTAARHRNGVAGPPFDVVRFKALRERGANGQDIHYALCLAGKHYVAELNDQPIAERKRP